MPVDYETGMVWEAWNLVRRQLPQLERRPVQNFTAFKVDDVYSAVRVLMDKHDLVLVPRVAQLEYDSGAYDSGTSFVDARVTMAYDVVHAEDASSFTMVFAAEGRDSQDKATNKASQQALKYALIQSLMIATGEPDAEDDPGAGAAPVDAEAWAATEAKNLERLTNAARKIVFDLADSDEEAAGQRWPVVLERAGVTDITTEEERDAVITAAHALYGPTDEGKADG